MKKMNKKSINLGFKMLSVLAFGLIFMPSSLAMASAYPTYIYGHYNSDETAYVFGHFVWDDQADTSGTSNNTTGENPVPSIYSINPKSGAKNQGTKTITIAGRGFTQNSVVRINETNRTATFVDPTHLFVQITDNDIYTYQANGGFFITVYNGAPGGGYSNAAFFTIKNATGGTINGDQSDTDNDSGSNSLVSSAIFGSSGILPSGLAQWIILGIFILIIIILSRKVFGAEKRYHETPLKHA